MLKIVSEQSDINYYHIISGQDIPVKSLSEFSIFENEEKISMQCENIKNKDSNFKKKYRNGVLISNGDSRKIIEKILNKLYSFTHKPRYYISEYKENDIYIYIGLVWCSFPQSVAKYILKYCKVHNFLSGWQHIKIPEEFFFQTIIANSRFKNKIVGNNLRYMDWNFRNGSSPAYLDKTDISKIEKGNYFFARKIDPIISDAIISKFLDL